MWQSTLRFPRSHGFPVLGEVDVVVVGGGAAGVAAASVLGEKGHSVLLVERYGFCGGGAVAGLSGTICGLYTATDRDANRPEQVVFGFTERFRARLAGLGGLTEPQRYGRTWTVTHDPMLWRANADAFLAGAGVRVLFHTQVVAAIAEEDRLLGVVLNSSSGMAAVHAKRMIDASGDADLAFRAGLATTKGKNGVVQNPTMIFRLNNVDVPRFLAFWGPDTISPQQVIDLLVEEDGKGLSLPRKKIWIFPTPRPHQLLCNATRVLGRDGRDLDVTDPADHSEAESVGRAQVADYAEFLRRRVPGCEAAYLSDTGVEVGVRQTRSLEGVARLANDDVLGRRKRPDGIARSPWPIELHYGAKPRVEWLLDDWYEVPYGALVPERGENLIVAGRCLSAEHEALASARVTAQCFAYGQAAALATDLSLRSAAAYRDIDGAELRQLLNADGARLD